MTRFRSTGALILLLIGAAVVYAQEQQRLANILIMNRLELAASVPYVMEGTTADGFEFTILIDPTEDVTWILPAAAGSSGQQLQTDGKAMIQTLSWASAASSKENKILEGRITPREALNLVLQTPVYRFHYKPGAKQSTQDFDTQYIGPIAEEAPWAMHQQGQILNPINALGVPMAAIQAQQAQIAALTAELAALKGR